MVMLARVACVLLLAVISAALHLVPSSAFASQESELCLVGYKTVYILPLGWGETTLPPNTTTRWSWTPSADGTIRSNNLSAAFNGTVECKPVDVLRTHHVGGHSSPPTAGAGRQLLVVSDTGGVAIVDRSSQRVAFCALVPGAHSAALMPDSRVAVVASHLDHGDRVAVFDIGAGIDPVYPEAIKSCQREPHAEAPVPGAHGVAWVNDTSTLLVVGGSADTDNGFVYSFTLSTAMPAPGSMTQHLALNLTSKLPIEAHGPHDLSPYPLPSEIPVQSGPAFSLTALNGVWLYLAGAKQVVPHPAHGLAPTQEVKSVSALSNGTLVFVVEDRVGIGPAHFRSRILRYLSPFGSTWRAWNVSLPVAWLPVYKARIVPRMDVTTASQGPPLQRPVFVPNEDGFVCFRALILLSAGPHCLIAASEGRSFYNPNTGGASWSALEVATKDNLTDPLTPHRLDLGSGVYDARSRQAFLHFGETTEPPGSKTPYKYAPHYVVRGDVDEGTCNVTWHPRQDITASDHLTGMPTNHRWCGCCGTGYQLPSGRLVVPGYFYQDDINFEHDPGHRKGAYNDSVQVTAFLSDDHGQHWFPGSPAPQQRLSPTNDHLTLTSEVSFAALSNGSLLFNSDGCGLGSRLQSLSTNEGSSWGRVSPTDVKDDGVMGGLVAVVVTLVGHAPQEIIVQSTAEGPGYRSDMHLFVSVDGGATYKDVRQWPGGCGYSDLTLLNDSSVPHNDTSGNPHEGPDIGLFYEGGSSTSDYSGQMSFVRINSASLLREYWTLTTTDGISLKTDETSLYPPSKSGFVQQNFVISMFKEPQATLHNYKLISQANFTTVLQEHAVNNASTRNASIALSKQLGLNVIAADSGIEGAVPNSDAVLGVYLRDEPPCSEFAELAKLVAAVRSRHPHWLSFINLYPYYPSGPDAVPHLGVSSYAEYLHKFVSVVDLDILCFDNYPEFGKGLQPNPGSDAVAGGNDTRLEYLANLAAVRNASLSSKRPWWNYFGVGAFLHKGRTHIDATEAEMRWQLTMSLTFGARGLLYFYWTPSVNKVAKDGPAWPGIVMGDSSTDQPTEHWYQAKSLNSAVMALAPTLMTLRSSAVILVRDTTSERDNVGRSMLIEASCGLRNISSGEFVVGCFERTSTSIYKTRGSWSRAVMIANFDIDATEWPTIELDVPVSNVLEVDQHTGLSVPIVDEVVGLPGVQIGLLAGGRRLLLLPKS